MSWESICSLSVCLVLAAFATWQARGYSQDATAALHSIQQEVGHIREAVAVTEYISASINTRAEQLGRQLSTWMGLEEGTAQAAPQVSEHFVTWVTLVTAWIGLWLWDVQIAFLLTVPEDGLPLDTVKALNVPNLDVLMSNGLIKVEGEKAIVPRAFIGPLRWTAIFRAEVRKIRGDDGQEEEGAEAKKGG